MVADGSPTVGQSRKSVAWSAPMGFLLFSIGNALAITGLVLAALGYAQGSTGAWIVALVAAGELTVLGSVLVLGDDGYQALEARGSAILRREAAAKANSISAKRHGAGMALLLAHLIAYFLVWITGIFGYSRATASRPVPHCLRLVVRRDRGRHWSGASSQPSCCSLLRSSSSDRLGGIASSSSFATTPPASPTEPEAPKPPPTLRYRIGLGVFIFGNLLAVTGMLLPAFGLANGRMVGVIAVILAAGEIISWSSIVLLGKEGFKELKTRLFAVLKRTPSGEPVSLRRHGVGVSLLALHVAAQFLALVLPIAAHFGTAADETFPTVLGLSRPEQLNWFVGLLVASEALFFAGVYTLGADWWGRFSALFRN